MIVPATMSYPPSETEKPRTRRQRFGLETPLPSNPLVIRRAILRHLAEVRPDALVLSFGPDPGRSGPADKTELTTGVPDLLLLLPEGRAAFLVIRTQAQTLTRADRMFADLCRARAVPVHVVRSLPEAQRALDHLAVPSLEMSHEKKGRNAGRHATRPRPARP